MTQDPSFINLHLPYANATVEDLSQCFVTTGEPRVMTATGTITNRVTVVVQAAGAVTLTLPVTTVGNTFIVATNPDNANSVTVIAAGDANFYLTGNGEATIVAGATKTFLYLGSLPVFGPAWLELASFAA